MAPPPSNGPVMAVRINNMREPGSNPDQRLDALLLISSSPATWRYDLPNGDYFVSLASADPCLPQGPHRVVVEGVTVMCHVSTTGTICDRNG
jgi:hypothetical protein